MKLGSRVLGSLSHPGVRAGSLRQPKTWGVHAQNMRARGDEVSASVRLEEQVHADNGVAA